MAMSIDEALQACADLPLVARRLQVLQELGLGYLTLGEQTPSLSGGEAQALTRARAVGPSGWPPDPFGGGGAAAEAGQRDGQGPVRRSVCV